LFKDGVNWIEKETGKKVLGVLPWYTHFKIEAEDSVEIEKCNDFKYLNPDMPAIGIIRLPHIANFTDFHALSKVKGIQTIFIDRPNHLSKFKAVIIPGSKNTRADLEWLINKFKEPLKEYYHSKGYVFGICGGYQMLGEFVDDPDGLEGTPVDDPDGLEGTPGRTKALNLLPVQTVLKAPKTTTLSDFHWEDAKGKGYEIHMGYTSLSAGASLIEISSRNCMPCTDTDGCISEDGRIAGTYLHGFFDSSKILLKWLKTIGLDVNYPCDDMHSLKQRDYVLLKEHFEAHIDMSHIF